MSKKIRTGIIGVGYRGITHLKLCLELPMVELVAVCDTKYSAPEDASYRVFSEGPYAYRDMLAQCALDLVLICTPWSLHHQQILEVLESGAHVAVEVKGAFSLEECIEMVEVSQKTGKQVIPLENTCYMRSTLAIKNMVREGLFGELVYLQAGYRHDLRFLKVGCDGTFGNVGPEHPAWRARYSLTRNADLYPTHGIAPLCQMLDINRGNRFVSLSSFSTKSVGIKQRIQDLGGPCHPDLQLKIALGDVITSVLTTERGEQVILVHDTNLPRPYSLNLEVQGTKGCWNGDLKGIYLEQDPGNRKQEYTRQEEYFELYDDPLWKENYPEALRLDDHHDGMDYLLLLDIMNALAQDRPVPMNVYDLAVWSAVTPLSEMSINQNGSAQDFPNFGAICQKK